MWDILRKEWGFDGAVVADWGAMNDREDINLENFTACVLHTDMDKTGTFTCSNPLVNKLQENIEWGQRGNFLDIPTDCPQRDERLGWTCDDQVFAGTAAYNYKEIIDEPLAVQLFNQYSPGMLDGPMIQFAYGMTINEMAANMPEEGKGLFKMVIDAINKG